MTERHGGRLECECGEWLEWTTNDAYMPEEMEKAWNEWHEDGSFVAGKWHRRSKEAGLK